MRASSLSRRASKVRTLLDTDGEALKLGLAANPTLVSPNQEEAERLLNIALITRTNCLHATERLHQMGAESVMLSLGSRGAVAFHKGKLIRSNSAARGRALSYRRGRRAVGGLAVVARESRVRFADVHALGRGGGNGVRDAARA